MSQETSSPASPDFLNPASMLTPGIAGAMTMMIANSLGGLLFAEHGPLAAPTVAAFINNMGFLALAISFLFGLLVLVAGRIPIWQRLVFYVINSLIIFSVAIGTNEVGSMAERAEHAGRSTTDGGDAGYGRARSFGDRSASDRPPIILASMGAAATPPRQLAQISADSRNYADACRRALSEKRDNNGNAYVSRKGTEICYGALKLLEGDASRAGSVSPNCPQRLKACIADVRAIKQDAETYRANWQNCEAKLRPLQQALTSARSQLQRCNQTVASLQQQVQAAQRTAANAQQALETARRELEQARAALAAARAGGASQAALDEALRNVRIAQAAADKAEQRATQAERRLSDARNELTAAQKREKDLQRRLDAATKSAGKSAGQSQAVATLERELAAARRAIEAHQDEVAALEQKVAAAEKAAEDERQTQQIGTRPIKGRFFKPWSLF